MITAIGNDYGFEKLFSRQIQAQSKPGDVFIGISTSGNSKNVIKGVEAAKELGVTAAVFCGEGGVLGDMADIAVRIRQSVLHIFKNVTFVLVTSFVLLLRNTYLDKLCVRP